MIALRRAASAEDLARQAAALVAAQARQAIAERGRFCLALSGGSTPWKMLGQLATEELPWDRIHLFQVDERLAPDGDAARNLTHICRTFVDRVGLPAAQVHAMPVTGADPHAAAAAYGRELEALAGAPAVLDLVHLGMGGDGHTASLLPGDPVLEVRDRDVALSQEYQGHRRMTLTYPALDRARRILWLISGADKAPMLQRLLEADPGIPAGRVSQRQAVVMTDIPPPTGGH